MIAALNEFPQRIELFTADADGRGVLAELRKDRQVVYEGPLPSSPTSSPDQPTVAISHKVWGEATITVPGTPVVMVMRNPSIESRAIRFINPGVALSDAGFSYKDEGGNWHTTSLLFVMKKEEEAWKIASIRIVHLGF